MSGGLIIRLRPREKFLINGAIIENGDKRVKLRVRSEKVNILRLRDALHPEDATTPVRRLYYKTQLALTGDLGSDDAINEIIPQLQALCEALPGGECQEIVDQIRNRIRSQEFYHAMRLLKQLLPYESRLLTIAATRDRGGREAADRP